jgi:hypothetical protein
VLSRFRPRKTEVRHLAGPGPAAAGEVEETVPGQADVVINQVAVVVLGAR